MTPFTSQKSLSTAAGPWREVFRSLKFKPNSLHSETSLTKGTGAQDEAGEGAETLGCGGALVLPCLDLGVGTKTPSAVIRCSPRSSYPKIPQLA